MLAEDGLHVSISQLCRWFGVARSKIYYQPAAGTETRMDESLARRIWKVIQEFPTYGLRRIHAVLKNRDGLKVNRKKVHRIIKLNGWQKNTKPKGMRPRVKGRKHHSTGPNQLWAIDTTTLFCGSDGWCYLTAVIDCFDRSIVGWRLTRTGKAKVAAAALEDAVRSRRIPFRSHLTLRSDNGLVFGAKEFVRVAGRHRVSQEYITPYSPEQNGMIERFFRSIKEECIWLHRFANRDHAFSKVADWMDFYNKERVHSALGYVSPEQYRRFLKIVA